MTVLKRSALVLLTFALILPASADESPKSLYHKGQLAEARQDYLAAYESYKAAYDKKPTDLRYRSAFERMRFQAAAVHVHKGQQLRQNGDLQRALTEFQTAAQMDPSSFIAQQEILRTQQMITEQTTGSAPKPQTKKSDVLRQRIESAQGPVQLAPINDQAITLRISGDTKTIYQTVGKLAGINVLFDPDYVSRQLPVLELNGVTLQDALSLIAIQSNTFWRPVTPNTIFVAPNTQTKRKELDQSVVKTFYLTNASSATEFQDIANTLRTILDITRVQPIAAENAIVLRGTPDQVALAEKIVSDLDKSRAEVVVDVAILQVSRQKIRDLGLQPPTASGPIGLQLTTPNQTVTTNTNGTGTNPNGTGTPSTSTNGLTLNSFKNLNATNFAVSVPQATLNLLMSDSNTRLLQNPQIRASDGQKASLKIGSRIPVATGSFQPGIGGVGINPLVNTQFQYLDVGVNIDIQPTVHLNGDVTLKVTMDISSETTTVNIGGIQQPVISQRKVEHQIRLKEGEVNMLGGILEDNDQRNYSGIPGLGQVPILKYIFGHENINRQQNEVVFVLIPHLVREQDVTDLNLRAIDVGTANQVELRSAAVRPARGGEGQQNQTAQNQAVPTPGQPVPQTQNAQPVPAGTVAGVQAPPTSATAPPASTPGSTPAPGTNNPNTPPGTASLRFDPPTITTTTGGTFTVNVNMAGGGDVASVPLQIAYDPKHLTVVKIDNGDFLTRDGQAVALVHRDDTNTGTLVASAARPPGSGGVSGQGTVFTITFLAKQTGATVLSIARPGARNSQQQPIQVLGSQMTVNVQ